MRAFPSSRERLERAQAHRKVFGETWNRLLEDEPYEVVVRIEDNGTGSISVYPRYDPLPSILSLELGEMLYQLRAALDSCIYQAAIYETGQDPPPDEDKLEFPICFSLEDFKRKTWKIKPLTGRCRRIVESIQPYQAPDWAHHRTAFMFDCLTILNDLARKDRHRRLHVAASWASNASPKLYLPAGAELRWMLVVGDGYLEDESEIATFAIGGWERGMTLKANPDLAIDVALREPPPPRDDLDTLSERCRLMCATVDIIIEGFEKSF